MSPRKPRSKARDRRIKPRARKPHRPHATLNDVAELTEAQEAIRRAEGQLRALWESMAEGVAIHQIVRDAAGKAVNYRLLVVNPAYEQIIGVEAATVRGKLATEAYGTSSPPYLTEFVRPVETGQPYRFETYFPPMDKHFAISVAPMDGDRFATIFFDITQQKGIEQERERLLKELEAKNKEMESLVYVTSHDLRSPLVNILGFSMELQRTAEMLTDLLRSPTVPPKVQQAAAHCLQDHIPTALGFIRSSGQKMDRLIEGLLRLSRTGRAILNLRPLDMNTLLENAVASISYQSQQAAARITIEPLPDCVADEDQISQTFSNLLDNALKYRDPQRLLEIRVSGHLEGSRAVYCVEDTGVGIAGDQQPKVWELFHRLDPSSPEPGEGLGLTLVKRIAERHGGRVWLDSVPGRGSRFYLELPAVSP
jgi:signal transduction histidine kinase